LRDPADNSAKFVVPAEDIEARKTNKTSIMPTGQVDQLTDRQQFLDLLRFLVEIRDGGTKRAMELKSSAPDSTQKLAAAV